MAVNRHAASYYWLDDCLPELAKNDIEQISSYVDGAWLIEQRQAA